MLVGAHDGRIEHHELGINVARENLENARKHATFAPSAESLVGWLPVTVPIRKITLRNTRAVAIEDRIDKQPIVGRRAADVAFAAG